MLRPNRTPKLKPEFTVREPEKEYRRLRYEDTSSVTSESQDWRKIGSPHDQSQERSPQRGTDNENNNNSDNDNE